MTSSFEDLADRNLGKGKRGDLGRKALGPSVTILPSCCKARFSAWPPVGSKYLCWRAEGTPECLLKGHVHDLLFFQSPYLGAWHPHRCTLALSDVTRGW